MSNLTRYHLPIMSAPSRLVCFHDIDVSANTPAKQQR